MVGRSPSGKRRPVGGTPGRLQWQEESPGYSQHTIKDRAVPDFSGGLVGC